MFKTINRQTLDHKNESIRDIVREMRTKSCTMSGLNFKRGVEYLFGTTAAIYIFAQGTGISRETVRRYCVQKAVPEHISMLIRSLVVARNAGNDLPETFAPYNTDKTADDGPSMTYARGRQRWHFVSVGTANTIITHEINRPLDVDHTSMDVSCTGFGVQRFETEIPVRKKNPPNFDQFKS